MKKYVALALGVVMFTSNVYGQITTNYLDEDTFDTTQQNYSISGSSDPNYPLYINGEEIDRTESGYFSYYASLNKGENKFELENTSDSKTITINRKASDSSSDSSSDTSTEDVFVDMDAVGTVNRNHPTVRSRPDEENDDLIGPYVKGTLVHITGQNSEYYRTANGAYLYTDSVELVEDSYSNNSITDVSASGDAIEIKMDRATEYKCDLTSDGLKLTLYDTDVANDAISIDDGIVESITKESDSPAVYDIKFKEKNRVVGYMSYFEDGVYRLELNERNLLTSKSLNGLKIVLDAGHGGWDNGTVGLGEAHEKDITLSITEYLGDYLSAKGAEIVYTRSTDDYVALTARTGQIIEEKPDVSVSIHCNSMNVWQDFNNYSGTLNLYTYDTPSEFVESLTDAITNSTYRKQNLALTRTSICPAVLIETGFICNPVEYEYFSKDENQKEMAEKIGYALEQYFYNLNGFATESTTAVTESTTAVTESTTETTTESTTETTTTKSASSSRTSGGGSSSSKASVSSSTSEAADTATDTTATDNTSKTTFADISNHWAESDITSAFEKGYVNGYENGTFKPNNAITRAEFIKLLYTIFGNDNSSDVSFADVSGREWYYSYIKWGVANGLVNGYADNTFRADKEITREEAAVILNRCVKLSATGNGTEFKDTASIAAWAKDSVAKISEAGIIQGDSNGYFNPKKTLTRAEAAVIANNIVD
jgi:N-acetylmuramoyl-L-alanine amidase